MSGKYFSNIYSRRCNTVSGRRVRMRTISVVQCPSRELCAVPYCTIVFSINQRHRLSWGCGGSCETCVRLWTRYSALNADDHALNLCFILTQNLYDVAHNQQRILIKKYCLFFSPEGLIFLTMWSWTMEAKYLRHQTYNSCRNLLNHVIIWRNEQYIIWAS